MWHRQITAACPFGETAVLAEQAGLSQVSDVALLKRLRGAERWWQGLLAGRPAESRFMYFEPHQ